SVRMTLTAMGRPPADMARKTCPIPPLPSCPSSRYGPISRGSSGCSPAYPTIHPERWPKFPFMLYPDDAVGSSEVYTRVRAVRFSFSRPNPHGLHPPSPSPVPAARGRSGEEAVHSVAALSTATTSKGQSSWPSQELSLPSRTSP